MADLFIRPETAVDSAAIARLLESAFPADDEARLVDRLRADGDLTISLVAELAGNIVGHVALSPMTAPFRALGLAPVAVDEDYRRRGIAARLIELSLEQARQDGWAAVFVLGDPAYYTRFGFSVADAAGFACAYAGPHMMVLALDSRGLPVRAGDIAYAPAFAALD
ncbi:GNAT family N-acetyltransferase [Sphingomonas sp. KC8]|uniref:GNAT family N-acetyltransferase n=1 Tax=Sphingomonas sp. KC8 TaxID=1030157 RepID=UPI0002489768|nr:N-acetyltransferase [Sphingomonas sp. KC8]ARS26178.1 hypothetical protein KC8_02585 [Sphingomonas sp. KC8]